MIFSQSQKPRIMQKKTRYGKMYWWWMIDWAFCHIRTSKCLIHRKPKQQRCDEWMDGWMSLQQFSTIMPNRHGNQPDFLKSKISLPDRQHFSAILPYSCDVTFSQNIPDRTEFYRTCNLFLQISESLESTQQRAEGYLWHRLKQLLNRTPSESWLSVAIGPGIHRWEWQPRNHRANRPI